MEFTSIDTGLAIRLMTHPVKMKDINLIPKMKKIKLMLELKN